MKKIKILSLLILISFISLLAFNNLTNANLNYEKAKKVEIKEKNEIVYICTGKYAKKYHSTSGCRGLRNCKGDIISVDESVAIKQGKTKCKICW